MTGGANADLDSKNRYGAVAHGGTRGGLLRLRNGWGPDHHGRVPIKRRLAEHLFLRSCWCPNRRERRTNGRRWQVACTGTVVSETGSAQETVKAYPFIGFGLERFYPAALGCQRWSPGPQCFRAEGPCLRAAFRILQTTGN